MFIYLLHWNYSSTGKTPTLYHAHSPSRWLEGSAVAVCWALLAAEKCTNSQQTVSASCPLPRCQILGIADKASVKLQPALVSGYGTGISQHMVTREDSVCVDDSPSESSLRKLFGISGCIVSPPTENTVFIVSMNHSLSGAYVWWFIGKKQYTK